MSDNLRNRTKLGLWILAGGIVIMLGFHLGGSWELLRFGGKWHAERSDRLKYRIPCYDARPNIAEAGRVFIIGTFDTSTQMYFPLTLALLRSGFAVRLVANSGSPNSAMPAYYESHGIESIEAARPFFNAEPDVPHFVIAYSEGTRYAVQAASEIETIDGVILISTVSAAIRKADPPNVLLLVAENDYVKVARQTKFALISGTKMSNPDFDKIYGDMQQGTARMAQALTGTNHISILAHESTQSSIITWLNKISENPNKEIALTNSARLPALAIGVLFGAALAVIGIGFLFSQNGKGVNGKSVHPWFLIALTGGGWGLAAILGNRITMSEQIPLLVYGRVLMFFVIATIPFLLLALIRPGLGAGIPRGTWKACGALIGVSLTLLLFDLWFLGVVPTGHRLFWFSLAFLVNGSYFAFDEFLRRGVQRSTDWQTTLALGLVGSLIAAISIAVAAFSVGGSIGEFLIAGSVTLFVLMVAGEIPGTYLFAVTGDWMLSWWVRVSIFNGFLVGIVPLISEAKLLEVTP
jgi:hypothetical protein